MTAVTAYRRAIACVLTLLLAASSVTQVARAASPQHFAPFDDGHARISTSAIVQARTATIVPSGDGPRTVAVHAAHPALDAVVCAAQFRTRIVRDLLSRHHSAHCAHHPSAAFDATAPPRAP